MHTFDTADLKYRHDVWMMQSRGGACLGEEPCHCTRVVGEAADNEFHRNFAAQADLVRTKHHAHTAASDPFEQFVIAEAAIVRIVEVEIVPQHRFRRSV